MSALARMLDANANRAREALRMMEDAARFALNDASLCGELKTIRHDLRAALDRLPAGWLEANRDAPGDVGGAISTRRELDRGGMLDLVVAAGKRLGESLRVIEEASKTINATMAREIESIRYRAYAVETRLLLRFGSGRARQWKLCVLLTESLCNRPWGQVLQAAVNGGAECIQIREKHIDDGILKQRVLAAIEVARPRNVSIIVNDRADVALAAGADGVHLGHNDLSVHDVRRIAGRELIVGVSTHDLEEAAAAVGAGADYCGVGAMFASDLKPDRSASGAAYLRRFVERYPRIPHLAIGGITTQNVQQLVHSGARGIAVSTSVCAADDPEAMVRTLRAAMGHESALNAAH